MIPFLFYCANDNITMQEYIGTDCFNRIFDFLLEYLDLLQTRWQGKASIWEGLGPARHAFGCTTV